jgi:hypothetical protein
VEIARRILREARRGVGFDEMAVLVRAPGHYLGLLEHALARADVPACFERGTRRPHAAGRAFLALLACAGEGLSANRFAEYLSLGQLPSADIPQPAWVPPGDELFAALSPREAPATVDDPVPLVVEPATDAQPAIAGTLRAPRQWERMLVEAAVIGGDPERWRRRLRGLAEELRVRHEEANRADPDSSLTAALTRDAAWLVHLTAFALPLVTEMAAWPERAPWGEWLQRFEQLAPRVLRAPAHVLRVLADLRPMAAVGPVGLDEVRTVLLERLRLVEAEPPARRYGAVFIGTPAQARGRSFRVVFVPGSPNASSRRSRGRIRCSRRAAPPAERPARNARRCQRPRARAAAPGRRRRHRAALSVVSPARRRRVARARAVVLRARRGPRRHRSGAPTTRSWRGPPPRRAMPHWRGRRRAIRIRPSTSSNTTSRCCASCSTPPTPGRSRGARSTCCSSMTRCAAPSPNAGRAAARSGRSTTGWFASPIARAGRWPRSG